MEAHLSLDPLEGIVDGLGLALETLTDRLIGVAVEIQRQDVTLQVREDARQAGDEALQLLAGDHLVRRVADGWAREDLLEGRLGVLTGCRRCLAE